ncbi:MAG: DNA polymerase beta superfamily protein [Acidimicrobiales bacterium]
MTNPGRGDNRLDPLLIFETLVGSRAYGLAGSDSDTDVKGVVVGPSSWYFGWRGGPEIIELSADHVRYELRRYLQLCVAANPTTLEMAWTRDEDRVMVHLLGERLLAERDRFLSKRVAERFGRYALSQLKRIRTHRSWLLSPPSGPPVRAQFGLPDHTVIPADQLAAAEKLFDEGRFDEADVSANFVDLLVRERRYKAAQKHWAMYRRWERERNPARAALEARYGYDTKHAMHLARLQRMALEILTTGNVVVYRPDCEELLAIRSGAWTFDELESNSARLAAEIESAAAISALPAEPDEDAIDRLCADLVAEGIGC